MRDGRRAFNLVEVVLAMGVASFVLVTLVGLTSVGLKMNRQSKEMIDGNETASFLISIIQAESKGDYTRAYTTTQLPIPQLRNLTIGQTLEGDYQAGSLGLAEGTRTVQIRYIASRPTQSLGRLHLTISQPPLARPSSRIITRRM